MASVPGDYSGIAVSGPGEKLGPSRSDRCQERGRSNKRTCVPVGLRQDGSMVVCISIRPQGVNVMARVCSRGRGGLSVDGGLFVLR